MKYPRTGTLDIK